MQPGRSTEPIWRTRITTGWNASADTLDVWVILEEFDTDDSWLGMRVLDESGHWREWITTEGASLGLPTQSLPAVTLTRTITAPATSPLWLAAAPGVPAPSSLGEGMLESVKKAMEKTEMVSGSPLVVSPAVREWIDSAAIKMEREFLFGKDTDTDR